MRNSGSSPKSTSLTSRLSSFSSKLKRKISTATLSSAHGSPAKPLFLDLPPLPVQTNTALQCPKSAPATSNKTFLPLPTEDKNPLRIRLARTQTEKARVAVIEAEVQRTPSPFDFPLHSPYDIVQGHRATLAPCYFSAPPRTRSALSLEDEHPSLDNSPGLRTPMDEPYSRSRPPLISKWTETVSTCWQASPGPQKALYETEGFPFPMQPYQNTSLSRTESDIERLQIDTAQTTITGPFNKADLHTLANIETSPTNYSKRFKELKEKLDRHQQELASSTSTYQSVTDLADSDLEINAALRALEGRRMSWSTLDSVDAGDGIYTANTSVDAFSSTAALHEMRLMPGVRLVEKGIQVESITTRSIGTQTEHVLNDRKA